MVKIIYILIKKKVITLKNLKEMLLKGENKNIKRILYLYIEVIQIKPIQF
jgi:hypothetical protein